MCECHCCMHVAIHFQYAALFCMLRHILLVCCIILHIALYFQYVACMLHRWQVTRMAKNRPITMCCMLAMCVCFFVFFLKKCVTREPRCMRPYHAYCKPHAAVPIHRYPLEECTTVSTFRPRPTACLLRGYGRAGTQNDQLGRELSRRYVARAHHM